MILIDSSDKPLSAVPNEPCPNFLVPLEFLGIDVWEAYLMAKFGPTDFVSTEQGATLEGILSCRSSLDGNPPFHPTPGIS